MYTNNEGVDRGGTRGNTTMGVRQQLVLWACKPCGYRNWPNRFKCRACMAKRTPDATIIAEQWSTAVLPAEVREHARGGLAQQSGGKSGKAGKGRGGEQTEGKGKGARGDDVQQEIAQPIGRKPTRFRLDENSEEEKEEGDGSSGSRREEEAEEPSDEEEATWAAVLRGKRKKKQREKQKEDANLGGRDADMEGPRIVDPVQIPSQPRKLLAARQLALQRKKEELQKGKGVGSQPGGMATAQDEGRGERRLRKVEEELECNQRDLKAAGGANAGNLKVALWHEGRRIQRTQKRLDFIESAIEEDEKAIEEGQRKWREHTSERSELREALQKRKARHAHLATELAGEIQADTEEVLGKLEWAMRNVEEAFAAESAETLDPEALREILMFCRKVVPPQNEIDDGAVLDYLSLESSSSDDLTQAKGGEETPAGDDEGEEEGREHAALVEATVGRGGAAPPESAEEMLEEALATIKAGTDTSKGGQEGAVLLALPAESPGENKEVEERPQEEGTCKEGRETSKAGKRQKVSAQGAASQAPEENCRACNDVLVGGIGQHSCECGALVCEACDGCNQCLRCLQPPPVRAAQRALAVDVRSLRGRLGNRRPEGPAKLAGDLGQSTGKGHKNLGRQRDNSRSPRGKSA